MKTPLELFNEYKAGAITEDHFMAALEQFGCLYGAVMLLGELGIPSRPARDFQRAYKMVMELIYLNLLQIKYTTKYGVFLPIEDLAQEDKEKIKKAGEEFGTRPIIF